MVVLAPLLFPLFAACSGDAPAPAPPAVTLPPPVVETPAPARPPPAPLLGASEVATPASVVRVSNARVEQPPRHLDVWFDPDHTTFAAFGESLKAWGFTVVDGDGESYRVLAPAGDWWSERLAVVPAVRRTALALEQDKLPSGALREGGASFGTVTQTWALKQGGVVSSVTGSAVPRDPMMPRTLPVPVVRCLAPIRADLMDGLSQGPGWERALQLEPLSWAVVVNHYGPCDATGWVGMRQDGPIDALTVGGRPAGKADDSSVAETSMAYLSVVRADTDEGAMAAFDVLRKAPDELLVTAIGKAASGGFQRRLWEEYARRDETAALTLAEAATSPTLRAVAAAQDDVTRKAVLADAAAGAEARFAAMAAWHPSPSDPPELQARLLKDADPKVREAAWRAVAESTLSACTARVLGAKSLDKDAAAALYRECPQQPVRVAAFARLCVLDKALAGTLVAETLNDPEMLVTGVAAVRFANGLERDDLLEAAVENVGVGRDVRLEALRTLTRVGRSGKAASLADAHGAYLGFHPKAIPAVANP